MSAFFAHLLKLIRQMAIPILKPSGHHFNICISLFLSAASWSVLHPYCCSPPPAGDVLSNQSKRFIRSYLFQKYKNYNYRYLNQVPIYSKPPFCFTHLMPTSSRPVPRMTMCVMQTRPFTPCYLLVGGGVARMPLLCHSADKIVGGFIIESSVVCQSPYFILPGNRFLILNT